MIAERTHDNSRSYVIRDDDGKYVRSLTFRDVVALLAVREGRARMVTRRRYSYGCANEWLEPSCDLYGVGHGTLWGLQRDDEPFFQALVTRPGEETDLALTPFGAEVLALVLALPGVKVREMAAC